MLVSAIGVVTTLWTSVNERTKEIGTMTNAKPWFISTSGASGGGEYIAPIFLPDDLVPVWLLSLTVTDLTCSLTDLRFNPFKNLRNRE